MMKKEFYQHTMLTFLIVSVILAACAPSGGSKTPVSLETLYSGTWHLVAYGNKTGTENVPPGLKVFISFQEDGNLYGNAGCNNFFGPFKANEKGKLLLEQSLGSTLMYCEGFMDDEASFLAAVQTAKKFFFNENGQLVINFTESDLGYDFMLFENQQPVSLIGTDWVLSALTTPAGEIPVSPSSAPVLSLAEDNSMTGTGGCNNLVSNFTIENGSISFGPVASTRMYCEGKMEFEESYTKALETVSQYQIIDDRLILSTEDFSTVLTYFFTKFTLEDTQWRLLVLNEEDILEEINVSLTLLPEAGEKEGNAFGNAGCNRYTGRYKLDGDQLTIELASLTAMFCEDAMDIEEAFITALQDDFTYQVQNNRLFLTSDNNALLFIGETSDHGG